LAGSKNARRTRLLTVKEGDGTLVFFESPKRLAASLSDMAETLGATRPATVCRELTKKFEEVKKGSLDQLAEQYANASVKGEVVVLVDRQREADLSTQDLAQALREAMRVHSVRDAAEIVAKSHAVPKRQVYQMALKIGQSET